MQAGQIHAEVAHTTGVTSAQAAAVIVALRDLVATEVAAHREISVPGFVKFTPRHREARTGRNPATGEAMEISARWAVTAAPLGTVKSAAN